MIRPALLFVIAAAAFAQQPSIENAKVQTRAFSGSPAAQLGQFGAGPFWAGYAEPAVRRMDGDMGSGDAECRGHAVGAPVRLEGSGSIVVLVRREGGQTDRLRVVSPDCILDGGGLPFYWISGVPADESVEWLESQVAGGRADQAIFAIAMHAGAAADRATDELSAPASPENVRGKTALWLGVSRSAKGLGALKRMLANDPSDRVRGQVIFAMTQSKDPAAMKAVIDAARGDKSSYVRQQALFWLAQNAGDKEAAAVIHDAAMHDSDRAVKEHAVFALTQLPHDQGIPMLIELAKTNGDPAVRKRAMFWLGQSNDPRALDFIAGVLKQ